MAKKRSHWELLLEYNTILEKELSNQIFKLNNNPFNWDSLDEKTKSKLEFQAKELREKLEKYDTMKQTAKEELEMATKKPVKPKENKYADKKGPKPANKPKKKRKP